MNLLRIRYADRLVNSAKSEIKNRRFEKAWVYLADAHIFAQPDAWTHFYVHWQMLVLAFKEKNISEFFGQVLRLTLSIPSSVFKKYPEGNDGRTQSGLFESMKISDRNQKKINKLIRIEKIKQREEKLNLIIKQNHKNARE